MDSSLLNILESLDWVFGAFIGEIFVGDLVRNYGFSFGAVFLRIPKDSSKVFLVNSINY